MLRKILITLFILGIIGGGIYFYLYSQDFQNENILDNQDKGTETQTTQDQFDVEVVAENLEIPWEIAFLPNGDILITERPGRLLVLGDEETVIKVEGVEHIGEGGLLGLTLHPDFEENSYLYLYLTSQQNGQITNRIERYTYQDAQISDKQIIIDEIPGASYHDGGRIEFGPDGYLYVTTGDAGVEQSAQDLNSLSGKILRLMDDGSVPEDNPFDSPVYSYGHRNPQGLAWDDQGNLWATEHGRSGNASGFDELNLIEAGNNYGWPVIQGDETQEGMVPPVIHSGPSTTWAPAGAEFISGNIFFAGLRGSSLYEVVLKDEEVSEFFQHLQDEYGRLRAVRLGPDSHLYVTTSNRDGRGSVNEGDDKLLRVNINVLD